MNASEGASSRKGLESLLIFVIFLFSYFYFTSLLPIKTNHWIKRNVNVYLFLFFRKILVMNQLSTPLLKKTMASVAIYDDHICKLGEGPVWDEQTSTLYWIDIIGQKVTCFAYFYPLPLDLPSRYIQKILTVKRSRMIQMTWLAASHLLKATRTSSCLPPVLGPDSYFFFLKLSVIWLCRFQYLDLTTGKSTTLLERKTLEEKDNNRFNDGKCDAKGRCGLRK